MTRINLFSGQVEFDNAIEAADFWFAYMKRMIPGLEEQCKKIGEDFAKNVLMTQLGGSVKAGQA